MTTSLAENKRSEDRYLVEETILIEVISSSSQSTGSVLMCNSLDISNSGMLVLTDEDIAAGSILRLCVDLKDEAPIFLVAEVKWRRPDAESGGYRMGFQLFESEDTDVENWKQHIKSSQAGPEPFSQ